MIKKNTDLYDAIKDTIYDMFDLNGINMDNPMETTEQFVKRINEYLKGDKK